ncbi:MAG: PilZ domain-containing protein [Caulobacteraceae bacterium]
MKDGMFGKSPPRRGVLADRVRQIAEAKPSSAPVKGKRQPRQPVFRNGVLIFDDGERLSVVIKDLSDGGVRVEFFVNRPLPATIMLSEPTLKLRRRARVVWQSDGAAGLAFSD